MYGITLMPPYAPDGVDKYVYKRSSLEPKGSCLSLAQVIGSKPPFRDVVPEGIALILHGGKGTSSLDQRTFRSLGIDMDNFTTIIDTQDIAQHMGIYWNVSTPGEKISLINMCTLVLGLRPFYLHNAGNDTYRAVQLAIHLALEQVEFRDLQPRVSTIVSIDFEDNRKTQLTEIGVASINLIKLRNLPFGSDPVDAAVCAHAVVFERRMQQGWSRRRWHPSISPRTHLTYYKHPRELLPVWISRQWGKPLYEFSDDFKCSPGTHFVKEAEITTWFNLVLSGKDISRWNWFKTSSTSAPVLEIPIELRLGSLALN